MAPGRSVAAAGPVQHFGLRAAEFWPSRPGAGAATAQAPQKRRRAFLGSDGVGLGHGRVHILTRAGRQAARRALTRELDALRRIERPKDVSQGDYPEILGTLDGVADDVDAVQALHAEHLEHALVRLAGAHRVQRNRAQRILPVELTLRSARLRSAGQLCTRCCAHDESIEDAEAQLVAALVSRDASQTGDALRCRRQALEQCGNNANRESAARLNRL